MEIEESIRKINSGQDLPREEISLVMNQILTGSVSEDQIKTFLFFSKF